MCGGNYVEWKTPRQKLLINGEPIVQRTIRLLQECGVDDIAISTNMPDFDCFGVPVLHHENSFYVTSEITVGYWVDAFYPMEEPVCYLFGDVVYSPKAIYIIVNTPVTGIEFFGSKPPFSRQYIKIWAEPFAFKVVDTKRFTSAIQRVKDLCDNGVFTRHPIAWELWQVISNTQVNKIVYNYIGINDYTCDIDEPDDLAKIEEKICQSI